VATKYVIDIVGAVGRVDQAQFLEPHPAIATRPRAAECILLKQVEPLDEPVEAFVIAPPAIALPVEDPEDQVNFEGGACRHALSLAETTVERLTCYSVNNNFGLLFGQGSSALDRRFAPLLLK
jgi:hypothetical protein